MSPLTAPVANEILRRLHFTSGKIFWGEAEYRAMWEQRRIVRYRIDNALEALRLAGQVDLRHAGGNLVVELRRRATA